MLDTSRGKRYLAAISLGLGARDAENEDPEFFRVFEDAVNELLELVPRLQITQKGLVYSDAGSVKNLRPRRFKGKNLSDYARHSGAEQRSVYLFDVLKSNQEPNFLAHAHSFSRNRIGNIPLVIPGANLGRFSLLALASDQLTEKGRGRFEEVATRLHEKIGGFKGGLLIDRGYVWNCRAGLEWAYREIPQLIPSGDVQSWRPPFDRAF